MFSTNLLFLKTAYLFWAVFLSAKRGKGKIWLPSFIEKNILEGELFVPKPPPALSLMPIWPPCPGRVLMESVPPISQDSIGAWEDTKQNVLSLSFVTQWEFNVALPVLECFSGTLMPVIFFVFCFSFKHQWLLCVCMCLWVCVWFRCVCLEFRVDWLSFHCLH